MAGTLTRVRMPSTVNKIKSLSIWTATVLISLLHIPATGYVFHPYRHSGSQPIQYLRVIRHRHPHYHHAASGHHPHHSRIRLHPSLHAHIHYDDDYPYHSGTHYHGHQAPQQSGTHYHGNRNQHPGTLHGYQLQGVGQEEPLYQPQQSGTYYDGENYYMNAPQSNGVQYSEQPQSAGAQQVQSHQTYGYNPNGAQYGQLQQNYGYTPSGSQSQTAGPYDQQNGVVNQDTGGGDYSGTGQNYGFHCKYSYGPYGKVEKCKNDPPLANQQYKTGGTQNQVASTSQYQDQQMDPKSINSPVETYNNNDNYVYVPAPWD